MLMRALKNKGCLISSTDLAFSFFHMTDYCIT